MYDRLFPADTLHLLDGDRCAAVLPRTLERTIHVSKEANVAGHAPERAREVWLVSKFGSAKWDRKENQMSEQKKGGFA